MKLNRSLTLPPDFQIQSEWHTGSMPPPAHFDYTIQIERDGGEVVFYPDYPSHHPPIWTEAVGVSGEVLSALHALIVDKQILAKEWQPIDHHSVGDSLESMDVTADGVKISIPSQLNGRDTMIMPEIYDAIRALVSQSLWIDLMRRREKFEEGYFEEKN